MAIFNPTLKPLVSKVTIGSETYYLKDADARALLDQLGDAAKKNVAAGVSSSDTGLVTGAQVASAIANLEGAMHFRGTFDTLPAVTNYNAGDVVIVGTKEYILSEQDKTKTWVELGDEGIYALKSFTIGTQDLDGTFDLAILKTDLGLGSLAYKSNATGTVPGQTISGVKATGTSTGSIDVALTQTSTAAKLTKSDYTPSGNVTGSVTAKGSVSIAKDTENGTQISGSVSAPTITVNTDTDTIKKVTSVGTLPSKAADTFVPNGNDTFTQGSQAQWSASVDSNETLSFSFTANTLPTFTQGTKASFTEGDFDAGSLPELAAEGTSVVTGIASATATQPVFTGDKFSATFSGSSTNIAATFAGNQVEVISGVNYDKASVNTTETKFNGAAITLDVGDIAVSSKSVTVS